MADNFISPCHLSTGVLSAMSAKLVCDAELCRRGLMDMPRIGSYLYILYFSVGSTHPPNAASSSRATAIVSRS